MLTPDSFDSCKAYGGCAYLPICGGTCTKAQYKAKFEETPTETKPKDNPVGESINSNEKESTMSESRIERFKRLKAQAAGATPEPEAKVEPTPEPVADPTEEFRDTAPEPEPVVLDEKVTLVKTVREPTPEEQTILEHVAEILEPPKKKRRSSEEIKAEKIEKAMMLLEGEGLTISKTEGDTIGIRVPYELPDAPAQLALKRIEELEREKAELVFLIERLYRNHGHGTWEEACEIWGLILPLIRENKLKGEDDE